MTLTLLQLNHGGFCALSSVPNQHRKKRNNINRSHLYIHFYLPMPHVYRGGQMRGSFFDPNWAPLMLMAYASIESRWDRTVFECIHRGRMFKLMSLKLAKNL